MSHGMEDTDQMFSVRVAPWHMGQGTNVILLDTAPETRMARIDAAGHAFIVEEQDVYRKVIREVTSGQPGVQTFPKLPGWKLLSRNDTQDILHVTQTTYTVVQNIVGHELFEALAKGAALDDGTGGTIKGGRLCYLSARLDEPQLVNGDDSPIYPYVVITWAHDGSGALQARRTNVRPVCWNTISFGEAEAKRTGRNFTFRHTAKVLERVAEAKEVIEGTREDANAFIELSNELAAISITDTQREKFVQTFLPDPSGVGVITDVQRENVERDRAAVRGIFDSPTMPEAHRNTAYGLVQAGIEYLDHLRAYRNADTYLGRTLLRDEPMKAKLVPMVRKLVDA